MAPIDSIAKNIQNFDSEDKCIARLEKMRWPEGVRCPSCGFARVSSVRAKGKSGKVRRLYQCLSKECRYQFSATTGTIFHDSHLPLKTWFDVIVLVAGSKEEISVNQLRLNLGIQYKTADRMVQRIQEAMQKGTVLLGASTQRHASEVRRPVRFQPDRLRNTGKIVLGSSVNIAKSMAKIAMFAPFSIAKYLISKAASSM